MPRPQVQLTLADESEEYRAFVDKFKPKKTTDDCYTPQPVYDAVADWVAREYALELDAQVPLGKSIFGGGYLMTSAKAAEREEAERRAEERRAEERRARGLPEEEVISWPLSERERALLSMIEGRRDGRRDA